MLLDCPMQRTLTEGFLPELTVKYITEEIFNSSANGVAFDVGTIFRTPFYGINFSSNDF